MISKPNGKTAPGAGARVTPMPPPARRAPHDSGTPRVRNVTCNVVRALGGAVSTVLNAFACVAPALASNHAHVAHVAHVGRGAADGGRRAAGIA